MGLWTPDYEPKFCLSVTCPGIRTYLLFLSCNKQTGFDLKLCIEIVSTNFCSHIDENPEDYSISTATSMAKLDRSLLASSIQGTEIVWHSVLVSAWVCAAGWATLWTGHQTGCFFAKLGLLKPISHLFPLLTLYFTLRSGVGAHKLGLFQLDLHWQVHITYFHC